MYKVRNKTKTVRKFREIGNPEGHWLRAGESKTIKNRPVVANPKVFEVTEVNKEPKKTEKSYEESEKKTEKRTKSKEEVEDNGTGYME